jgi:hypothetical protein
MKMLKKELTELLKSAKDDDNIDEILGKAEPVKALVNSGLTLDAFKSKLESDPNFKSFADSEKDKHLQKGLETFKKNNLQSLVDTEYKKQHPDADPKDTKIAELEAKYEQMQKDAARKDLTNKALQAMTEKKLPTDLVNFIVGEDEKTTKANLETLTGVLSKHDEALKTEILKGSYKPGGQGGTEPTKETAKAQINSVFGIK